VSERKVRAILLDVDGTLLDSNDAHARAWVEVLREDGIEPPPLERVRRLIGMGGDKLLPEISGIEIDSPHGKKLGERRKEIFKRNYLPALRPTPGARALVERLARGGVPLVVATSAESEELKGLLQRARLEDLLTESTTSSDAESSKPDPDIITAAVKKAGVPPAESILIGDTPYDIAAARRAGVRTIAVRCGGWGDDDLFGAIAIYDDPAELLASIDRSPLAALGERPRG
jgi:HAD superfamily hydrolase (TIGR01509 family)